MILCLYPQTPMFISQVTKVSIFCYLEDMLEFNQWLLLLLLILIPLLFLQPINKILSQSTKSPIFPTSYPIFGHFFAFYQNRRDRFEWLSNLVLSSPSSTFTIHRPFGGLTLMTADPVVVEHILKTRFAIYQKGPFTRDILRDLLRNGIFNANGKTWKFQRQVASHEFNTKSLRKFVESVVDTELSDRLIPILSKAAKNQSVLDFQDILQRFTFDNVCKIAFGYDPEYLSLSLPHAKFAVAFEDAVMISSMRLKTFFPISWKIKRLFNVGCEKRLKEAVHEIREFASSLVRQKKQKMLEKSEDSSSLETEDLLSRFLKSGHSDEEFVTDIVISFILAGRDTTSSALTWFFWLLHKNKNVEEEIVRELENGGKPSKTEHSSVYEEVKDMMYTHAALCECMRLYPPVPVDTKEAVANDILPSGTPVKKGTRVAYHPYAMGRVEGIWGPQWAEYRPERWLEVEEGKWRFVPRDPYSYPVFQAGPRVCLGKEMAFLQMKRMVAGILERFKVVPVVEEGFEPVYLPYITAKMEGGLPVRIEERV